MASTWPPKKTGANSCQSNGQKVYRWELDARDHRHLPYPEGYGPDGPLALPNQLEPPTPAPTAVNQALVDARARKVERDKLRAQQEADDADETETKRKEREELDALNQEEAAHNEQQKRLRTAKDASSTTVASGESHAATIARLAEENRLLNEALGKDDGGGIETPAVKFTGRSSKEAIEVSNTVGGVPAEECLGYRGFDNVPTHVIKKGLSKLLLQVDQQRSVRRGVTGSFRLRLFFHNPSQLFKMHHFFNLLRDGRTASQIETEDPTFNNALDDLRQHPAAGESFILNDPEKFHNFLTADATSSIRDFQQPGQEMDNYDVINSVIQTWALVVAVTFSATRGDVINKLARKWVARQGGMAIPAAKVAWKVARVYEALSRGLREDHGECSLWSDHEVVTSWIGGVLGDPFFIRDGQHRLPVDNLREDWQYSWDNAYNAYTSTTA